MIRSRVFLAYAGAALIAALPGKATAAQCTPLHVTVSSPRPGITVYAMPKDYQYGEEKALGPLAMGAAADGSLWFTFHISEANGYGTLRDGKIQHCTTATGAAADDAFKQGTGLSVKVGAITIKPAIPAEGMLTQQAVAPNGVTWFTVEYTGRNGNPTNGGNLGSIDKAGHVRMYQIPGAGASLAIAAGKDGTIWLGDYYSEQIIKVDPSKL